MKPEKLEQELTYQNKIKRKKKLAFLLKHPYMSLLLGGVIGGGTGALLGSKLILKPKVFNDANLNNTLSNLYDSYTSRRENEMLINKATEDEIKTMLDTRNNEKAETMLKENPSRIADFRKNTAILGGAAGGLIGAGLGTTLVSLLHGKAKRSFIRDNI